MPYHCQSPAAVKYRALDAYIRVRCRQCEHCMKARQWQWYKRAAREQFHAKRTWFATLTFGPRRRAAILRRASELDQRRPSQARLVEASGWFVSTFTKRLRKAGFEFRYLWVPEPHADGFPHYHGLVHDTLGSITWEDLSREWSAGFSVFKGVRDLGAIRYVTKYLAKGRYGRVRASTQYGVDLEEAANSFSVPPPHETPTYQDMAVSQCNEGRG